VGKPNAPLFLEALDLAGGGVPLVIGDRLDTDIAGAAALGWDSLLVLSGIAGRADLDAAPVRPTYVADDLSILSREPSASEDLARSGPEGRSAAGGILGALFSLERIRIMNADDVRKMLDSVFDKLSPAKAQELAKGLVGDDRREHAQKLAADLMDSAQRNRDKVKDLISREVAAQVKNMGVATQKDLDALRKRVRDLERAAGITPKRTTKSTSKSTSRAKRPAAQKSTTKSTSTSSRSSTA
jgi:polyhydroxyalkanoate synthesis regulator phasin